MDTTNVLFIQLAVILGLSAAVGLALKFLEIPLLVAYLIVGVILSLLGLTHLPHTETLKALPEIGVALVLFFIGMELDLKEIRSLGKPIIAAGLGQIILSILAGFVVSEALGTSRMESIFLGIGLSFSSTIVVVKLLLEKKDLTSLYGKLSIGILLLEDLVAIILLMGLTVGSSVLHLGLQDSLPLLTLFIKGFTLLVLALVLSRYVLARVFKQVADSSELLFLAAVAWCFIFVSISILLGFSVVIGAFLAGVALANSPFHFEIQGKVKPLRDFFVTLFFVYLGSQVVFIGIGEVLPLIVIFTLYALIIKPIIFLLILGIFGFRKHTIFQTAINLSQISEFSLIIMVVGLQMKVVSQSTLTAMALTGVLSMLVSSMLISSSRKIYKKIAPFIGFFEHTSLIHQIESKQKEESFDHVVLIGAHRIGGGVMRFLKRENIPFVVLDFNPKVIEGLVAKGVHALYGDVGDSEVLEFLNLEKAKLIISTAQDIDDNLMLLAEIKRRGVGAPVITRAGSARDAKFLYKAGSEYVVLPEIVSGDYLADILKTHWPNMDYFRQRPPIELNKLSKHHLSIE